MPLQIIICGGGIGGLTVAGYLRAAHHDVTVLERGQLDFSINDYGLSVVSNAFGLLQKAGIDASRLDLCVMTHFWIRNHKNEEIQTMDFDTTTKSAGAGAPSILARRANVQSELLRFATGEGFPGRPARVVKGVKVVEVDVDIGKVVTDDGREFHGDLIIGADGINSVVRATIATEMSFGAAPVTHDLLAFMTQIPVAALEGQAEFDFLVHTDKQAGLVMYRGSDPANPRKRILLYHISPSELQVVGYTTEKEFKEKFDSNGSSIVKDVSVERVVDDFGDFSAGLCTLFKHSQIDAWRIRDLEPLDTWTLGKAVLIGDAAHAVTPHAGQGCNVTIEDAEALAYLLKDAHPADDFELTLKKFVELRKDRVQFVARHSREIGNVESEEDRKKGIISEAEFGQIVYGYQGIEAALDQLSISGRAG
jgi:salicylate hydroxylase